MTISVKLFSDQRCDLDEKIEVIELDASQFESELNNSVEDELIPGEPQLPNEQASRVEPGETHEPTLTQNGALDRTVAATEVVDLGCDGQSSGCFFNCSSSPCAIRSLDSSTDSTSAEVEYVPPDDLSAVSYIVVLFFLVICTFKLFSRPFRFPDIFNPNLLLSHTTIR